PAMLLDWLEPRHPEIRDWPAVSTAGAILKREGLVQPRRKRSPRTHPGVVDPVTDVPNDLWTADFKGQFRTQDHVYCYPLTIADQHTRFLLTCHGLKSVKGKDARPIFERTFREYGLPRAIRTDNGAPFVTRSICGLSHLNVWWMRLGIQHQRIRPASPQENGAHERMHRTLKREAIRPPRATMRSQQRAFDAFRAEYNDERPHTHHGGKPPGSQYDASPREYPSRLPALEYPGHYIVKRVTTVGTFRFNTKVIFIANALRGYHLGFLEEADGIWSIYFGEILLAKMDERNYIIRE
ncbi:MAG TPA: integrase core domain-containing protein, partial [Gemmatimonadaceae bacterium]|nr:integrase core domain-containing protein [Gemmatimonadaceae bacterium]